MVKPKPVLSKQPIRTKENITKSQWKLKQNKQFPEARENADYQGAICFSFKSDWLRKWREFSLPIPDQGKNQSSSWLLSTTNWKLLYYSVLSKPLLSTLRVVKLNNKKNQKLTWNPVIISSFLFILCSLKRRYEKTHCFQNALGEENTKKSCTLTRLNILMNKKTLIPDTRYINYGLKSYCSHQLTYAHFEKIQFYFNYKLWRITTSILSMKKATNLENFSKNLLGQLVCWESGLDHMLWKSI